MVAIVFPKSPISSQIVQTIKLGTMTMKELFESLLINTKIILVVFKLPSSYNITIFTKNYNTIKKGNTVYIMIDLLRIRRIGS